MRISDWSSDVCSSDLPSSPQAVVADFMDEGHFAAHIRRMRKLYAERHDALMDAAREKLAGLLDVVPTDTGLHTVGFLRAGIAESAAAAGRSEESRVGQEGVRTDSTRW